MLNLILSNPLFTAVKASALGLFSGGARRRRRRRPPTASRLKGPRKQKSFAYKLLKRGLANLMSPTSTSGVAPPLPGREIGKGKRKFNQRHNLCPSPTSKPRALIAIVISGAGSTGIKIPIPLIICKKCTRFELVSRANSPFLQQENSMDLFSVSPEILFFCNDSARAEDELRDLVVETEMSVKNVSKNLATSKSSFKLLTYSSDFGAARLDPCELRTVVPYTYTLSERSAELHATPHGQCTLVVLSSTAGRDGIVEFEILRPLAELPPKNKSLTLGKRRDGAPSRGRPRRNLVKHVSPFEARSLPPVRSATKVSRAFVLKSADRD
ncbi:hypothetical protein EVAR_28981_1 [Eumeta japonica]|uniref:Uncharacterized protein n=1 Tax=Eumeta variegata TaxID=151549 RepID=A0A4C1W2G3_EUMVA|nr:hypothetical protein EVAR_28981_1 [Eumeta japonica]